MMGMWCLLLLICIETLGGTTEERNEANILDIGGIFPIRGKGGWQGGQACQPAARLALDDVNEDKTILPGYKLRMHYNDSQCEPGLGALVMYDLLYQDPTKLMLLAGCSTVCTTVAEAAKMWNLVVLCYGASSPALSDRQRFKTLFRTHPSATVHNPTRVELLLKYGWSRIAILQQAEEVFISTVEDLEIRCKERNIEIITRQSFLSDPADAVKNLKRQDARIIVGLFYVVAARKVLCEMYKQQLYGKSYVWFFIGWYEDDWFTSNVDNDTDCQTEELMIAAEGHLTTEAVMWNQNRFQKTISGMTAHDFQKRLDEVLLQSGYGLNSSRYPPGYQEAPLAYDAVWAVALAFNKTMNILSKRGESLKSFTYTNEKIASEIYSAMNSTEFLGISGVVAFSSQGDRVALTQVEQVQNGSYVKLAYYDTEKNNFTWLNDAKWIGNKVPTDRTIIKPELRTLNVPLFLCMWSISVIGILVAIGLIVFNVYNRHRRVIQFSHPVCNTIMLVGVIVCLTSVILLGLDGQIVSPEMYPLVCQGRAWLLSIGFTLGYGAMFSKVWRVHRLTTKTKNNIKKKIQPWKLYSMVAGLLMIDLIVLSVWQIYDPLQRSIQVFPLELPISAEDDIKIRPELEHCESTNHSIWLGIALGYKGVILAFGLFLAYETRSIKVKQINDSRYVGMSIYNVVVLCVITTPVTMIIASQQDASFTFTALSIIFCCFLSMALIFVPKVIEVIRHPMDKAESKYNPDYGLSKEEEDKYHKLLAENDELFKLIKMKEDKIIMLRLKLAEKEAASGGMKPDNQTPNTLTLPPRTDFRRHT
ncbi:gamma-aminobutyric acid type B receptor subunit 1 isoform X2 [Planococcus citri]|uniref:gamma-aminobutyric acid type B receptor subunit 1 isoform X2 n=1 Tax=Planococcus citri TaxID=170843 RepID=UPI0031F8E0DE